MTHRRSILLLIACAALAIGHRLLDNATYAASPTTQATLSLGDRTLSVAITDITPPPATRLSPPEYGPAIAAPAKAAAELPAAPLQAMLDAAPAGSAVTLPPGTYAGSLALHVDNLTVEAHGVVLDAGKAATAFSDGGHAATVDGLTIDGAASKLGNDQPAMLITTTRPSAYTDCTIRNTAGQALAVNGAAHPHFTRCAFTGNGAGGWGGTAGGYDVRFVDCINSGNNTQQYNGSVGSGGGKFTRTHGLTFTHCQGDGNYGPALWLDYQNSGYTVENCEFSGNKTVWQTVAGKRTNVCDGQGVMLEISYGGIVIGNTFAANESIAMWVYTTRGATFSHNTFADATDRIRLWNGYRGYDDAGNLFALSAIFDSNAFAPGAGIDATSGGDTAWYGGGVAIVGVLGCPAPAKPASTAYQGPIYGGKWAPMNK